MVTRLMLAMIGIGLLVTPVAAETIAEKVGKLELGADKLAELGKFIFETEGSNTCSKCHGKEGHGGDQQGAADLRHPKTWRSYQALGGDEAFEANKEEFLKNMQTALHFLINKGGSTWNQRFAKVKDHKGIDYDWSKVETADKYDTMMKGVTSGAMSKSVKALKEKLGDAGKKLKKKALAEVATVAAFEHVKTLDDGSEKGGVFK